MEKGWLERAFSATLFQPRLSYCECFGGAFLLSASCFVLKQERRIAKSSEFMKYSVASSTTEKPFH